MERQLLNLIFNNRSAWEKLRPNLKEGDFSPPGWILLSAISEFYEADSSAERCDNDILLARLARQYPKAEVFKNIISGFKQVLSAPNIIKELYDFKRHLIKQSLATRLLDDKNENIPEITKLYEEYTVYANPPISDNEKEDGAICAPDVASIIHNLTDAASVVKLYPRALGEAVGGGVPRQTHIVLFGPPEIGKSAVWINQVCMSARDGLRTLVFDNEDPKDNTWSRVHSRITGMSKQEIRNDPTRAQELLNKCGYYDKILIMSKSPGTIHELDTLCSKYKPDLLVVNQIRHLYFRGVDGEVQQLTAAGKGMRSLIKNHNLVGISVSQGGDSARNKAVLDAGDVYMSNTSLPGDADILLGIGGSPDMIANGMRMLSLPKNKMNGNHEPVVVNFNEQLSKFTSL